MFFSGVSLVGRVPYTYYCIVPPQRSLVRCHPIHCPSSRCTKPIPQPGLCCPVCPGELLTVRSRTERERESELPRIARKQGCQNSGWGQMQPIECFLLLAHRQALSSSGGEGGSAPPASGGCSEGWGGCTQHLSIFLSVKVFMN